MSFSALRAMAAPPLLAVARLGRSGPVRRLRAGFLIAALTLAPLPAALAQSSAVAAAVAAGRGATGTIRISHDFGGSIAQYMRAVDGLRDGRSRVEILGDCRSACTLFLGAGNACVSRHATLRFHGPSRPGHALTPAQFEKFSRRMAGYYPEPVRSWFLATARYRRGGTFDLSGAELIAMGVPEC